VTPYSVVAYHNHTITRRHNTERHDFNKIRLPQLITALSHYSLQLSFSSMS